jgi:hypothetical protein
LEDMLVLAQRRIVGRVVSDGLAVQFARSGGTKAVGRVCMARVDSASASALAG